MQSRGNGTPTSDDLIYDAPSSYVGVDASPDLSFDAVPDVPFDVVPDVSSDVRGRSKNKGRSRMDEPAAPRRAPPPPEVTQAISVCLSCGASPPEGGDCPHDEVAHLAAAGSAVVATVRKLAAAVLERHTQERALRRLVALEVSGGRGEVDAPMPALSAAPLTAGEQGPCTRCGHKPTSSRASRKKAAAEAQRAFSFAAAPERT
jgi:hypothetical protein